MNRTFSWKLIAFLALACVQTTSAQTAGSQPIGTHTGAPLPDVHFDATPAPRTSAAGPAIIAVGSPLY